MSIGKVGEFKLQTDDWQLYVERLEQYKKWDANGNNSVMESAQCRRRTAQNGKLDAIVEHRRQLS